MPNTILVTHGSGDDWEHYRCALTKTHATLDVAHKRARALELAHRRVFDLAITAVDLGDRDPEGGYALCRDLRSLSPCMAIIMVGANDSEMDRLSAFRAGADEFLATTASPEFLAARSRTLIARLRAIHSGQLIKSHARPLYYGRLRVEQPSHRVFWDGCKVDLSLVDARMLLGMVESPGEVQSLDRLMEIAGVHVQPNTITAAINRIRKRFSAVDPEFDAIANVHGRGYRWVE